MAPSLVSQPTHLHRAPGSATLLPSGGGPDRLAWHQMTSGLSGRLHTTQQMKGQLTLRGSLPPALPCYEGCQSHHSAEAGNWGALPQTPPRPQGTSWLCHTLPSLETREEVCSQRWLPGYAPQLPGWDRCLPPGRGLAQVTGCWGLGNTHPLPAAEWEPALDDSPVLALGTLGQLCGMYTRKSGSGGFPGPGCPRQAPHAAPRRTGGQGQDPSHGPAGGPLLDSLCSRLSAAREPPHFQPFCCDRLDTPKTVVGAGISLRRPGFPPPAGEITSHKLWGRTTHGKPGLTFAEHVGGAPAPKRHHSPPTPAGRSPPDSDLRRNTAALPCRGAPSSSLATLGVTLAESPDPSKPRCALPREGSELKLQRSSATQGRGSEEEPRTEGSTPPGPGAGPTATARTRRESSRAAPSFTANCTGVQTALGYTS